MTTLCPSLHVTKKIQKCCTEQKTYFFICFGWEKESLSCTCQAFSKGQGFLFAHYLSTVVDSKEQSCDICDVTF